MIVLLLLILGTLVLVPFVAYELAKNDKFFTRLQSGDIKFVMRGDTLHKIIHDARGKTLITRTDGIEELQDGPDGRNFFNRRFGLYWIGFPPFASVHTFRIKKETENPSGENPDEWITPGPDDAVKSLRFTFPRPYVLKEVEMKDRLTVDLLVLATFEVVVPYMLVFLFKGRFFEKASPILRAQVADKLNDMTLDDFIPAPKGEMDGILKDMKNSPEFNAELYRQVGLKLTGISITQWDPSDAEIRAAIQAEELAKKQGEAKKAQAKANAEVTKTNAEAQAEAEERLAKARGARIRETVEAMSSKDGDPNVVAQQVGKILQAEALTGENSKFTTWVDGGGAQPFVNVGGDKK